MTMWAVTGLVPPARGVIESAAALPAGFLTVKTESTEVVVTRAIPTVGGRDSIEYSVGPIGRDSFSTVRSIPPPNDL